MDLLRFGILGLVIVTAQAASAAETKASAEDVLVEKIAGGDYTARRKAVADLTRFRARDIDKLVTVIRRAGPLPSFEVYTIDTKTGKTLKTEGAYSVDTKTGKVWKTVSATASAKAAAAMEVLANYRASEAVPFLISRISFFYRGDRIGAHFGETKMERVLGLRPCVSALTKIGRPAVRPVLAAAGSTPNEIVLKCCAAVLVGIEGREKAIELLKAGMGKVHDIARKNLMKCLDQLTRLHDNTPWWARPGEKKAGWGPRR